MKFIPALADIIRKHKRFLLSVHLNPDGDGIGSVLAFERLLKRLGKKTQVVCQCEIPRTLDFLPRGSWKQAEKIQIRKNQFDVALVVDVPSLERLGKVQPLLAGLPVINVDHHVSNQFYGDYNFLAETRGACAEIVYELFKFFKLPLTRPEAILLYTGISTDTGSFCYSNTTPETHRVVAEILATGLIRVEQLNQLIYSSFRDERLRLIELLLKNRHYAYGGKLAYSVMTHAELMKTHGRSEDMESSIDLLRGIQGVKACFIMTEWKKGALKVSFRSSSDTDVNKVANCFGGGGHKKASGATLTGSPRAAVKKILDCFKTCL